MQAGDEATMTIGEIAGRFGLATHVLRHWESVGLLTPAEPPDSDVPASLTLLEKAGGRRRRPPAFVTYANPHVRWLWPHRQVMSSRQRGTPAPTSGAAGAYELVASGGNS